MLLCSISAPESVEGKSGIYNNILLCSAYIVLQIDRWGLTYSITEIPLCAAKGEFVLHSSGTRRLRALCTRITKQQQLPPLCGFHALSTVPYTVVHSLIVMTQCVRVMTAGVEQKTVTKTSNLTKFTFEYV